MSTPSSSSIWNLSYIKLRFFTRIRKFVRSKAKNNLYASSDRFEIASTRSSAVDCEVVMESATAESCDDDSAVLQRSVKRLHFGSWEEKEIAAMEIAKLAREDLKTRKFIAALGVIPALVSMAASEVVSRRRVAVKALIELANGTYTNKGLMVEAGILSKLPDNMELVNESTTLEFSDLLLSLSSLPNTQFPISSSNILPFLISVLESNSAIEVKQSCLGTLYNLSTVLENSTILVSNGVINTLLKLCSIKKLSEKSLGTLGNLVVTLTGKKAMEISPMVPENLIEILTWDEIPKCQELSAYILMILAHQSSELRDKMAKSGIVSLLLEVALLGSPLAQKRALKLLQWFKDERQAKMGPHSGPQTGRSVVIGSPVNRRDAQEGKKMMKNLVKQSLYKNMEMITRRANAAGGGDSYKLKSFVSTSSKSLPY